jgi:hypothetical protein
MAACFLGETSLDEGRAKAGERPAKWSVSQESVKMYLPYTFPLSGTNHAVAAENRKRATNRLMS